MDQKTKSIHLQERNLNSQDKHKLTVEKVSVCVWGGGRSYNPMIIFFKKAGKTILISDKVSFNPKKVQIEIETAFLLREQ